jgi:hypothetical protein
MDLYYLEKQFSNFVKELLTNVFYRLLLILYVSMLILILGGLR